MISEMLQPLVLLFTQQWIVWLERLGPMWFSALGTFVIHETFYFGSHIFWTAMAWLPYASQYKLQPKAEVSWTAHYRCLIQVLFNHACIELPMMMAVEPVFGGGGLQLAPPFTTWWRVAWVVAVSFVLEDFYFYWVHRFLHWVSYKVSRLLFFDICFVKGPVYRHVHKLHHDHAAPFGMAAEYAHPVETLFLGFGSMIGPILCATHLLEVWVWLCFRLVQTVEVHCGYDFPWAPNHWIPFWGGAKFHDFHHERFTGNYASTFVVWDAVFGTDEKYRARLRGAEERTSKKQHIMPTTGR